MLNNKNIKNIDISLNGFLIIIFSLLFLQYVQDDTFITFRYGYNFFKYGVWNWNNDHNVVEAYTNFSYAALSVIPYYLGISNFIFIKIFGYCLLALFIFRARSICNDNLSKFFITLFLAINPYLYAHFLSGLETPLFMVLILEIFIQTGKIIKKENFSRNIFYTVVLLLPLTRPEGAVFSLISIIIMLKVNKWRLPKDISFWLMGSLGVLYFIWRYQYFGYILPNTVYKKSHQQFGNITILFNIIDARYYIVAIIIMACSIKEKAFKIAILATIAVHLLAYVFTQLAMNYAFRFFMQIYIPLFVYAMHFIGGEDKKNIEQYLNNRAMAYFAAMILVLMPNFSYQDIFANVTEGPRLYNGYKQLGEVISKYKKDNITLMVGDAGVIPYYADVKTYDAIGLADAEIAHKGNSVDYMTQINPDIIMIHSTGTDLNALRLNYHDFDKVYTYIKQQGKYEFVTALKHDTSYYISIFVKKDLRDFKNLKHDLITVSNTSYVTNSNENKGQMFKDMIKLKFLNFNNPKP